MQIEKRYRAYLVERLAEEPTMMGRIMKSQSDLAWWLLPILLAGVLCLTFSLAGIGAAVVLIPALAVSLAGGSYVSWAYIKYLTDMRKSGSERR